jgi:hypothetical protein
MKKHLKSAKLPENLHHAQKLDECAAAIKNIQQSTEEHTKQLQARCNAWKEFDKSYTNLEQEYTACTSELTQIQNNQPEPVKEDKSKKKKPTKSKSKEVDESPVDAKKQQLVRLKVCAYYYLFSIYIFYPATR